MTKLLSFFVLVILLLVGIYLIKKPRLDNIGSERANKEQNIQAPSVKTWHEFSSADGRFKVFFPALPQRIIENIKDKNTGEDRKYEMYMSQKTDGSLFMISVIRFPKNPTQDRMAFLRTMMNDVIESNPNNRLLKVESGKFKEFDSLVYSVENNEMNIEAVSFIADGDVYSLTSLSKKPLHDAEGFDFFIKSFNFSSESPKSK